MEIDLTYNDVLNDEINYYWIGHTEQFSSTRVCTDTLENAIEYAKRSQPNYRPFYIIKAVTHFEIIGIVNKRGKFQGYGMDTTARTINGIQEILEYLDTTLHPIVSPDNWNVYCELYDMVSRLPSAQPEQEKGHWIPVRGEHQCDRCGCYAPSFMNGEENK